MIHYAAEHGYERITWDTGATNAARYDLSKHIAELYYWKTPDGDIGLSAYDHHGGTVLDQYVVVPGKLPDVVGKEMSEKIIADDGCRAEGQLEEVKAFSGLDLEVGGEGMAGFYDKILPAAVAKLTRKFGGKVEEGAIEGAQREKVHSLTITPQLREAATEQGFPLFQSNPRATPAVRLKGDEIASHDANLPALRKAARNWYRDNLAGTTATNPMLGEVMFAGRGLRKALSASANPVKLRLFPAVKDVIESGQIVGSEPNRDPVRKQAIRYHWIEADVEMGGETHRVRVAIEEHRDGKLYYNHTLPEDWHFQDGATESPSKAGGATKDGAPASSALAEPASSRPSEDKIGAGSDSINLQFAKAGEGGPRGRIMIGENRAIVDLFTTADRSTFMHEMGHLWLDELARDAAHAKTPQALKDDLGTVLRWLGVDKAEDIGREHQEKWAEAFEHYIAEGRAPSAQLEGAFAKFKAWLVHIYRSLMERGVELPDEIRSVMDRLLATDEEIAAFRASPAGRIADLPRAVKMDAMRIAIAGVTQGEPVRVGEALEIAAKSDPRIVESADVFVRPAALSAAARELPPLHDGAYVASHGDHGPIVKGYEGRWAEAVDWLKRAETGDLKGVLEHPQIDGRIDVVWGNETYGLSHILAKHPEIVDDLPNTLNAMRKVSENANRIILEGNNARAVVSRVWHDEPKTWLLTAFTRDGEGAGPGGEPGLKPATDLRSPLSLYYGGEGAGPSENIGAAGRRVESEARGLEDWKRLAEARNPDEEALAEASRAAERLPEPLSLATEPSKRAAAAEAAAAEAEAEYRAAADYIPDDIKARIEAELKVLEADSADRAEVIRRGAACLAAAVG